MAESSSYDDGLVASAAEGDGAPRWSWRRIGLTALTGVLVFAVGLAATIGVLLWRGERSLGRTSIEMPGGSREAAADPAPTSPAPEDTDGDGTPDPSPTGEAFDEVLHVLVVGSDSREGLDDEHADLTHGDFEGTRTDTIMLLRVDPRQEAISAISFPRDLRVPLCGHAPDKITHAYTVGDRAGVGGPACLVDTVTEFSGTRIDHFVQVDFAGFIDLVNELGGVTMYLDEPMRDRRAHLDIGAGCQTLDGREALGFVRTRADSDFGRIARQQRFLHELIDEVATAGTVLNVPKLYGLVDAGASAVTVDEDMSVSIMRQLAMSLRGIGSQDLRTETVPTVTDTSTGVWYELPIEGESQELFEAFRRGELAPDEAASEAPTDTVSERPRLTADDVPPLRILNAAGVGGLAGSTADALRAGGFAVAAVGNGERSDRTRTVIRYPSGHRPAAEFLEDIFDGATLEEHDDPTTIEVLLGSDIEPEALDVPTLEPTTSPTTEPGPTASETEEEFANAEAPEHVDC